MACDVADGDGMLVGLQRVFVGLDVDGFQLHLLQVVKQSRKDFVAKFVLCRNFVDLDKAVLDVASHADREIVGQC